MLHSTAIGVIPIKASTPVGRSLPSWFPYAAVGVVALVVLAFVLANALGPSGTSGSSGSSAGTKQQVAQASSPYYLAVSDGKVAIFSNSSATPYEVSDVAVSDLGSQTASALDAHVSVESIDEAHELVETYRKEAEATQSQRKADSNATSKTTTQTTSNDGWVTAPTPTSKQSLYPQAEGVNLRSEARHNSSLAGEAYPGDVLYYYGESAKGEGSDGSQHLWYYVNIAGTNTWGWVRSDLVYDHPVPAPTPSSSGKTLYPQAAGVNLRSEPRHNSSLAGEAYPPDVLYYYGESAWGEGSDGAQHLWYYVNVAGTNTWGWVRSDLVNETATSTSGQPLYPQDAGVNLRSEPRHNSALAGEAYPGDVLYYFGESSWGEGSDGAQHLWYYVNIGGTGTWGWVRSDLVYS